MGEGNLGAREAAWGSKLWIDPSQLNNPEKHVRRAKGCYVDAKKPGVALRRKTLWKKHRCLPVPRVSVGKAGVDLGLPTWIFTHQPMSLGELPWVSLSVFIVEQGKDLPRGNHVGSN